jgi:hypothetical protein
MVERGIDIYHVRRTIQSPDTVSHLADNKIRVSKYSNGKILEVIYLPKQTHSGKKVYLIITGYYLKP